MKRKIALVGQQINLHSSDQSADDLNYWLSKEPSERLAAVTFLIRQNLKPNQRMDRKYATQRKKNNDA